MKMEVFIKRFIVVSLFLIYIFFLVNISLFKFTPVKSIKSNFKYFSIKQLRNRIVYCNFMPLKSIKSHFKPSLDLVSLFKDFVIGIVFFAPFGFLYHL